MQIHEITIKKNTQVEEGVFDTIGGAVGRTVSGVKNVGSAIAAPFKDVAQGYSTARQDQKVSAVADKAFRAWQKYVSQLEQSIAVQPAPAPATTTSSTGGQTQKTATGLTHKASANNPNNTAPGTTTPGATATTSSTGGQTGAGAKVTYPATGTAATTPAKPNYGAQTGAGAKVTYNQPAGGIPNTNTTQPTNAIGPKTPGVTVSTPGTVAGTAPGQPITVGGQKLKPGTPNYEKSAKMPIRQTESRMLKELQASPGAVSPALAAFRDRTDGKYEQYLTAFVQKNLLSGMGFNGLVNQGEITNAIKAIAAPANADPAKQRPLWNDLVRAAALAVPAAGALTGRSRTPGATKDSGAKTEAPVGYKIDDLKGGTITKTDKGWFRSADNYLIPTNSLAHKDYEEVATSGSTKLPDNWYNSSGKEQPPEEQPTAQAEPAKPTMTRAQISQWISRNSEDHAALKAALDAINAVKG